MQLRNLQYWKTKEVEKFYVFKAKITHLIEYDLKVRGGQLLFEAEYYENYPLSDTELIKKGSGKIFVNAIPYMAKEPEIGAVIELMARPHDLESGKNWKIYLPQADVISEELLKMLRDL